LRPTVALSSSLRRNASSIAHSVSALLAGAPGSWLLGGSVAMALVVSRIGKEIKVAGR